MHSASELVAPRRAALLMMAAACLGLPGCAKSGVPNKKPTAYAGVQTGNLEAESGSTIYILFDPLCSGCRQLYQQLQSYDPRFAFKWLPVNVLRPSERSEQMAASVLVEEGAEARANLKTVMAGGVPKVMVTLDMRDHLRQNEAYLKYVSRKAGRRVAVPTMLRADGSLVR